jgi:hypothetical protein
LLWNTPFISRIMIPSSSLFPLRIKVLGLTAIAAILFSADVAVRSPQRQEEPQVEPDGGLIDRANGNSVII